MTREELEIATKLLPIFFPYLMQCRERVIKNNGRFVHYTSAANALKIINTKRIWMRNATCMSDYREVQHGYAALQKYFIAKRPAFDTALNECVPGAADEAFRLFDQWWQNTQLQTYITSISEHDKSEDVHGRLSMWRAFGGATARVAIVIKLQMAIGSNQALNAMLSPVSYFTDEMVASELNMVIDNVRKNREFLSTIDRRNFRGLCTMHLLPRSTVPVLRTPPLACFVLKSLFGREKSFDEVRAVLNRDRT
jgi:hypothetical protein